MWGLAAWHKSRSPHILYITKNCLTNMRRAVFICFLFVGSVLSGWSQGIDSRKMADACNTQLNSLLHAMSATKDSASYFKLVKEAIAKAVQCDQYDTQPNARGKVKLRYRNENKKRVGRLLDVLADGGLYYYRAHRYSEALSSFDYYLEVKDSPLFDKHNGRWGQAALLASELAYGMKDYQKANTYADVALRDNQHARRAAEVKVNCMRNLMRTSKDSLAYKVALLELHDKEPENVTYKSLLIALLSEPGKEKELFNFVNEEVQKYPENKAIWDLKGETHMRQHQWLQAIAAFEHSIQIDSMLIPPIYNIGLCYALRCAELKDSLEKDHSTLTQEEIELNKELLERSKQYLEKVRKMDPQRQVVDWATPLYQVCYALGDKNTEALRQLINKREVKDE